MAMKKCKECGKEVSTKAKVCPNCGKKHPTGGLTGPAKLFLALIIIVVIGKIFSSIGETPSSSPSKPQPVAQKPVTPPKSPKEILSENQATINTTEARLKEYRKKMQTHYPGEDWIQNLSSDLVKMVFIETNYKDSKDKSEIATSKKASSLIKQIAQLQRSVFASTMEQKMMEKGFNMDVKALGRTKTSLQLKFALMSKALVYNFRNEGNIDQTAKRLGFKKIIFTDGFDSTWTVDLK